MRIGFRNRPQQGFTSHSPREFGEFLQNVPTCDTPEKATRVWYGHRRNPPRSSKAKPRLDPLGKPYLFQARGLSEGRSPSMTTSVIQQKRLPKDYCVHIKGDSRIPLYHRSGEKPLDPTTLATKVWQSHFPERRGGPADSRNRSLGLWWNRSRIFCVGMTLRCGQDMDSSANIIKQKEQQR